MEDQILHETENFYLFDTKNGLEIRLNRLTHSVVIGNPKSVESAKRTMARFENNLDSILKMYGCV